MIASPEQRWKTRVDEATQLVAVLLELVNPLGLLPEEINPRNHGYLDSTLDLRGHVGT